MLWLLIAVLMLVSSGAIVSRLVRRRELPEPAGPAGLLERTLRDVRPDDVIQVDGADWLVEGVITLEEDGHVWRSARVSDGKQGGWMWIGLERGQSTTVRLLTEDPRVSVTGNPPDLLRVGGLAYRAGLRGTARATFQGSLPALADGAGDPARVRFWTYSAGPEDVLVVEQWGERVRGLLGRAVPETSVELLAAS